MTKKFEFINSESHKNIYYLIIYPKTKSFSHVIDEFNRENNVRYNGKVKSDLIFLTGDRTGRFIEGDIVNGKIKRESFEISDKDTELINLAHNLYMDLPDGEINKIYPVAFRNQLKAKRLEH